ncbi:unnamed protein product, partial [Tilletia controversa]
VGSVLGVASLKAEREPPLGLGLPPRIS